MNNAEVIGSGILRIKGEANGPTIGAICNIHGNEPCGRKAVQKLLREHTIECGTLVIIDANPNSGILDRRFVISDMNRLFTDELLGQENPFHDLERAQYLAKTLPTLGLDHCIDFHSTSGQTRYPFAVSFPGAEQLTNLCPVPRIYGWPGNIVGTLVEWLCQNNIPTVTIEGGQHVAQSSIDVSFTCLGSLLSHFGLVSSIDKIEPEQQLSFEIHSHTMIEDTTTFKYSRIFDSFDELQPGELIAKDSVRSYSVPNEPGYSIMMPGLQDAITNEGRSEGYFLMKAIGD